MAASFPILNSDLTSCKKKGGTLSLLSTKQHKRNLVLRSKEMWDLDFNQYDHMICIGQRNNQQQLPSHRKEVPLFYWVLPVSSIFLKNNNFLLILLLAQAISLVCFFLSLSNYQNELYLP